MTRTVLLTLGRLPKALDLARALSGAGCRVLVAEPFGWHLCRVSRHVARSFRVTAPNTDRAAYLREMSAIIEREGVDLVVPVSEEALHAAFLDAPFFGMPQPRLMELHHKSRFNALASSLGLAVPETHPCGTPEAAALAASGPVVVKPALTCSGIGMRMLAEGEAPPADPALLAQRRLPGRPVSSFSVAHQGRVIGTAVYRPAVESGTVAVAFAREYDAAPAVEDWVRRFVTATGWSGFISFDFMLDAEGVPQAIECNPRATSGVHFMEPSDLADAILAPETAPPIRLRRRELWQQFFPVLTETWAQVRRPERRAACLRTLIRARDVTWGWSDPLPLLTMPMTASQIIWRSIRRGESFGEAATFDIGWFGEP